LEKIESEGIQEFEKVLASFEANGAHAAVIAIHCIITFSMHIAKGLSD
jgi:hypothetical protein